MVFNIEEWRTAILSEGPTPDVFIADAAQWEELRFSCDEHGIEKVTGVTVVLLDAAE